LLYQKFYIKKPYSIKPIQFYPRYIADIIYKWTFGYGYRARNFIVTFIFSFAGFYLLNYFFWNSYQLSSKDVSISSFNKDSVSVLADFYYTAEATTKLIDSQIQPTSDFGMNMLTLQSIMTFVLLSALITVIANRFIGK